MAVGKKNDLTKRIRRGKPPTDKLTSPTNIRPLGVAWLVAYPNRDMFVHAMTKGTPVLVGRSRNEVDFVIADDSVSRQHATFVLKDDGVHVTDKDSTNSTVVRGEPIDHAVLKQGDEVLLGNVRVVVNGDAGVEAGVSYERLLQAIGIKITESAFEKRTFVLAAIRRRMERGSNDAHVSKFVESVVRGLRPVDQFAVYGPEVLVVLLPNTTKDDAKSRLIGSKSTLLDIGLAAYPDDGQTIYDLEGKCLDAMQQPEIDGCTTEPEPRTATEFVVVGPVMTELLEKADRFARTDVPVMIRGETGVGKELFAKRIHQSSARCDQPFVVVNCGAIPKELAESELFGHVKGAFTGAHKDKAGVFRQAHGGTLFLDEVADLPLSTQVALLRALQDGEFRPVGSDRLVRVNVRIVAATNRPLEPYVQQGKFRDDLYYRVVGAELDVPPLRRRREEIPALVAHFIAKHARRGATHLSEVSTAAMELLEAYSWPGNIRQLSTAMQAALADSHGATIEPRHLPGFVHSLHTPNEHRDRDTVRPGPEFVGASDAQGTFWEQTNRFQRGLLMAALEKANHNVAKAAKALGLGERPMRSQLKRLRIDVTAKKG